jgi:uncharacterized DUF497 family protein
MQLYILAIDVDFEWDRHNERHVRDHQVEPEEAEQALLDPARLGTSAYNVRGERRWAAIGATEEGRILFAVFTRRRSRVRVITGREARGREKRRYRRQGP